MCCLFLKKCVWVGQDMSAMTWLGSFVKKYLYGIQFKQ